MKKYLQFALPAVIALTVISCDKEDEDTPLIPTVVKEFSIPLSAKFEVPAPAGRNETGTATVQLLSNNSVKYTINVTGLASGDALTAAHLHAGNVATSAGIILGLNPVFSGSTATGTIEKVRTTLIDSLYNGTSDIYLNVHSTQAAAGLVRGQINATIEMAADVVMNAANEVPAGTSAATGLAIIRLTSDRKLYTSVTVSNLETLDALTAAHYHKAAAGTNAGVFLGFYSSAADFGTVKINTLDLAQFTAIKTDPIYVNAHSTLKPGGVIRGQLR